jgi:hypothetical protein
MLKVTSGMPQMSPVLQKSGSMYTRDPGKPLYPEIFLGGDSNRSDTRSLLSFLPT